MKRQGMKEADFSPSSQALLLLLLLQKFPWTDLSRAGPDPCVLPGTQDGLQGLELTGGPGEELQQGPGQQSGTEGGTEGGTARSRGAGL